MERYQEAAATMTRCGLARAGAGVSLVGRFAVLVTQDRVGEMTADLERVYDVPGAGAVVAEMYALALAAAGRVAEARAVAGPPQPLARDVLWLFLPGRR
jgi:bifunctional ADP-heptose synthase (sugar kinase/adenylyltransferase)